MSAIAGLCAKLRRPHTRRKAHAPTVLRSPWSWEPPVHVDSRFDLDLWRSGRKQRLWLGFRSGRFGYDRMESISGFGLVGYGVSSAQSFGPTGFGARHPFVHPKCLRG